jgi:exopolysaccharide biosynthesis polyprenyl glycosylphosphotransferase
VNKFEEFRRMIRFGAGLILVAVQSWMFMYMWIWCYNAQMEMPYQKLGHYFLAAVYALILYTFSNLYGSLHLGYLRNAELIYTHTIATICANAVSYIPIVLLVKHFRSVMPLVGLSAAQFVVICIWGIVANGIYCKVYPPRKVIMVYGEHPVEPLVMKLATRQDRFEIGEKVKYCGNDDEILDKLSDYEGVVICDLPSHIRNQLLKYCYAHSLRAYYTPKISDIIIRSAESMHYFDTPLLLSRNDGLKFEQALMKRLMDIVVSLTMLIVLSPIMLVTAVLIRLYDGGPAFFYQERCTKDGKIFKICKFRSMIVNAEKDGVSLPATERDPRITPIGHLIRKTRIDELPQLINILKGEMSLVGPRPERIEHVKLYSEKIPEFAYRMKVKGGLTGYAQVYGKYNTTAYDKLKLDLMYIQNYSVLLDIEILFQTLKIVFLSESTEGFDETAAAQITQETEQDAEEHWEKDED